MSRQICLSQREVLFSEEENKKGVGGNMTITDPWSFNIPPPVGHPYFSSVLHLFMAVVRIDITYNAVWCERVPYLVFLSSFLYKPEDLGLK